MCNEPAPHVLAKLRPAIGPWLRDFIALSPFVVLSTADANGRCDASPRGGPPGFVSVLDPGRVFIPEAAGNRLLQTQTNLRENPFAGLLFFVPGVNETARVNGRAIVVGLDQWPPEAPREAAAGERRIVYERGILVEVEEAYYHCGRALSHAALWSIERIESHAASPPIAKRPSPERS